MNVKHQNHFDAKRLAQKIIKSTSRTLDYLKDSDKSDYKSAELFSRLNFSRTAGKKPTLDQVLFPIPATLSKMLELNHSCHVSR